MQSLFLILDATENILPHVGYAEHALARFSSAAWSIRRRSSMQNQGHVVPARAPIARFRSSGTNRRRPLRCPQLCEWGRAAIYSPVGAVLHPRDDVARREFPRRAECLLPRQRIRWFPDHRIRWRGRRHLLRCVSSPCYRSRNRRTPTPLGTHDCADRTPQRFSVYKNGKRKRPPKNERTHFNRLRGVFAFSTLCVLFRDNLSICWTDSLLLNYKNANTGLLLNYKDGNTGRSHQPRGHALEWGSALRRFCCRPFGEEGETPPAFRAKPHAVASLGCPYSFPFSPHRFFKDNPLESCPSRRSAFVPGPHHRPHHHPPHAE